MDRTQGTPYSCPKRIEGVADLNNLQLEDWAVDGRFGVLNVNGTNARYKIGLWTIQTEESHIAASRLGRLAEF
jgi:hypothetical protein